MKIAAKVTITFDHSEDKDADYTLDISRMKNAYVIRLLKNGNFIAEATETLAEMQQMLNVLGSIK